MGCGLGFFSERLVQCGAQVTACDIGPNLLRGHGGASRLHGAEADALHLSDLIAPNQFDIVVSSECIEHTRDPARAIREMCAS